MTSLSSTVSQRDLRIGDRVIVSSSQGSKTGVLRYYGTTEFAVGEWCGVELDDPIGKNDGSVNDKRCASLFQIYTLIQYLSKDFQLFDIIFFFFIMWNILHFHDTISFKYMQSITFLFSFDWFSIVLSYLLFKFLNNTSFSYFKFIIFFFDIFILSGWNVQFRSQ